MRVSKSLMDKAEDAALTALQAAGVALVGRAGGNSGGARRLEHRPFIRHQFR